MERIVLGISAINFNNSNEIVTEKSVISGAGVWSMDTPSCTMATSEADGDIQPPDQVETELPSRRSSPARLVKCKENSVLRLKRRSIMKPRRNLSSLGDIKIKPSDVKKLYLENKIKGNFRPTNLETIFEEPTAGKNEQLRFIGAKKIRRSLSCSDGLNVTKTTVKSRRLKVRKTFGRRFALKKISLEDFIDRLNASFEDKPTEFENAISIEEESNKTDKDMDEGEMDADEALFLT